MLASRAFRRRAWVALVVVALAACSDGGPAPAPNVVGVYHASSFTATIFGATADILAAGGTLNVTLAPNGTTAGRLVVPASATGGFAIDQDLAGTWTQTGTAVTFAQAGATLVQDVTFTVTNGTLVGEQDVNGAHIRVVLSR